MAHFFGIFVKELIDFQYIVVLVLIDDHLLEILEFDGLIFYFL